MNTRTLTMTHPVLGEIAVPVFVQNSDGFGAVEGSPLVGNAAAEIVAIEALWLNLPLIYARSGESIGGPNADVTVTVDGWQFTLVARSDLAAVDREAQRFRTPYFVTHEALLERVGSEAFRSEDGLDVLVGFQLALSFGLGRFVPPLLPRGLDRVGNVKWEGWQDWRCDSRWGVESWLAPLNGEDVSELLTRFISAWLDADRRKTIRHGVMGSVCAHNPAPTAEAGVMLAQAELEAWAWHKLVVTGPYSSAEYRAVNATDRITEMLAILSIDTSIPGDLEALLDLATEPGTTAPHSGPGVASWVRNRLTHPKDPEAAYLIKDLVWHAKVLLLEYLDLVLLYEIGYSGGWRRLYPPGRSSGTTEPVPWST